MRTGVARAGRAAWATRVVFFVAGAAMSAWAPLVPFAKAHAGIDNATLGLVLLCFGTGSVVLMPLTGRAVARHGCRVVILIAALCACIALPLLALASTAAQLAGALLLFGAGLGALDVSMNLHAIAVERDAGRAMMSGFHALFSLGGIGGALAMSALLGTGVEPLVATLSIGAALVVASIAAASHLLSRPSSQPGPMFGIPRGVVLLIGLLCLASFLIEGAMLDWSAIFLSSVRGIDVRRAGIGYAAFSLAMVTGRLTGDRVVQRFGRRTVLTSGAIVAAGGVLLVAAIPDWRVAVTGFVVIGLGCANLVPILFSAAGRQTVMPESLALPAVTTLGYAGLLAGPALIGFAANATSLSFAFVMLSLLMLAVGIAARRLPP